MVPPEIAITTAGIILFTALLLDRIFGDPHSPLHPVALLGRFIGIWGRPGYYSPQLQRIAGVVFWIATASLFALPFSCLTIVAPGYMYLLLAPFFLKVTFAWRSLEEHTLAVVDAVKDGVENGREKVKLLVSRDTAGLDRDHILSAGYESMTENLTDSIISPLFYFSVFGLVGAAIYRAANTMDAMLGYRDERIRLGWFSARMDDILNFIPARVTVLFLLLYFLFKGRSSDAFRVMRRDGSLRPGFNGGIVMAVMAGGCGTRFEKPKIYTIGDGDLSLEDAGPDILRATRAAILMFVVAAGGTLFLLGTWINSNGI
ncbi:MAG: Cobalamin biosynthesis protein CbiB [Methanoregula sp. SKADARSKE-2]|nr:MAG: Cobalamin biosynthesis protein CbiB [Methanoregula sp. SKADARSKE-2]